MEYGLTPSGGSNTELTVADNAVVRSFVETHDDSARTWYSQVGLLIFNYRAFQRLSKLGANISRIKNKLECANERERGNVWRTHVVGGCTEYLSTMRSCYSLMASVRS